MLKSEGIPASSRRELALDFFLESWHPEVRDPMHRFRFPNAVVAQQDLRIAENDQNMKRCRAEPQRGSRRSSCPPRSTCAARAFSQAVSGAKKKGPEELSELLKNVSQMCQEMKKLTFHFFRNGNDRSSSGQSDFARTFQRCSSFFKLSGKHFSRAARRT